MSTESDEQPVEASATEPSSQDEAATEAAPTPLTETGTAPTEPETAVPPIEIEPMPQDEAASELTSALATETESAPAELETAVSPIESMPQDEAAPEATPTLVTETETATREPETAVAPLVTENEAPVRKKRPAPKKQRKPSSRKPQKNQPTLRYVTDRFAACGRCSYFWAGYRVIYGEEALATAVAQSQSGWLALEWNLQMPELVHKSYGVRLDITHFHYAGCCKECRRPFVYQASKSDDELDSFEIGITPRVSP